jgi:hypothetical protein
MRTVRWISTPSEGHQSEEEDEDAVVDNEEVEWPFAEDDADRFPCDVNAPVHEQLHAQHGQHLRQRACQDRV